MELEDIKVYIEEYKDKVVDDTGQKYYDYEHDIKNKKRYCLDDKGMQIEITGIPNSKVVDNQYRRLVDAKLNFLIQQIIVETEDTQYYEELIKYFDKGFTRILKKVLLDLYNYGIGWLYTYYNEDGRLSFKKIDSKEVIPIWADNSHDQLLAVIRRRTDSVVEKGSIVEEKYIEFYHQDGCIIFNEDLEEVDTKPYLSNGKEHKSFNKIPFIYFKSEDEKPLLNCVKSIQDSINTILSNLMDNMLEDPRNTILVVKNYGGEDMGKIKKNLAVYGILPVTSDEGGDGGVETLSIEVNSNNYEYVLSVLKEKLIENGKGLDVKSVGSSNTANMNMLNIKSAYADMEMAAASLELELQASFEYLQYFVKLVHGYGVEDADISFKRNILVSEESIIEMIKNSSDLLSKKTLLANHPLVNDVEEELERLDEQMEFEVMTMTGYPSDFGRQLDYEEKEN